MADVRRVLVAGATGGTGGAILGRLDGTDLGVQALTRREEHIPDLAAAGVDSVVVGDLLDPEDAERAVEDVDAVLCAVGTGVGPGQLFGTVVDGEGVRNLVDAAEREGAERFVLESAVGVGDSKPGMSVWGRLLVRNTLRAKGEAEAHLRGADLAHTILRPGRLTDGPATGDVLVGEGGDTVSGSVPRADVARLMVAAPFTPESEGRTFEVVSREGARGDPGGVVDVPWTDPADAETTVVDGDAADGRSDAGDAAGDDADAGREGDAADDADGDASGGSSA